MEREGERRVGWVSMMDKSCHPTASGGDSTTSTSASATTSSGNRSSNSKDQYLNQLNKLSHKISKPTPNIRNKASSTFDHLQIQNHQKHQASPSDQALPQSQSQPPLNLQQHQPPVYNINKSDFRDVVQKLTGSPAHERFSTPPPIQPPKPPSSRLQRIRPPPLSQVSNRPPPLINGGAIRPLQPTAGVPNLNNVISAAAVNIGGGFNSVQRQPLSPLPPFPAVHAAAESPISAYMRYLQSSISTVDSNPKQYSGLSPLAPLISPRWNNHPTQHQPPPPTSYLPQLQFPVTPSSPLPFGCLPSPKSPYPLLSPTGQLGFQQFPLSPTVPVPSPRWKGI